MTGMQRYYSCF